VQYGNHRAGSPVPLLHTAHQGLCGFAVNRVEGFVQQEDVGILHQQASEQGALQLPVGERADHALFKTLQADGG